MPVRPLVVGVTALALAGVPAVTAPAGAAPAPSAASAAASPAPSAAARATPPKQAVAVGRGGAVSSVDPYATRIGLRVLARGGNATDAAVATAAALGVTEPYSAGIGGGGYFVRYGPWTGNVRVIDGRETAPQAMPRDAFIDPETGDPYPDGPALYTSGAAVGVPGTPQTWADALATWGSLSLRRALAPAAQLAERGFRVDDTFALQTQENAERFAQLRPTARLFLPGGAPPEVGSIFRNPDLAATYRLLGERGLRPFYRGAIADQIVRTVRQPPTTASAELPVPPGFMRGSDLAGYRTRLMPATHVRYRGLDVYGMPPSSSGGTTVGEALNILERLYVSPADRVQTLHSFLEASALAFADRAAYLGDPAYVDVPVRELLSQGFASERACQVDPDQAAAKPVPAGVPDGDYEPCEAAPTASGSAPDGEGRSTTHLSVVDRNGSMVAYTLTIEQTGGSAITVPGRGFLLNNELTDFSTEYVASDPNRIQGGKRPRSSMSPTIVLRDDQPWLALGSPGGSTIITTVLQTLLNRIDLGMSLPRAIAAPRAAQRNTVDVTAEQSFIDTYGEALEAYGHTFVVAGEPGTSAAEIGAVAAVERWPGGRLLAAAEPERRGGGAAGVVRPEP
jgi:gamma-glutamyltranspeptidase/glutathione hydrolase